MKIVGYHRTSTKDQHLERGITEITKYCDQNNLLLKKIYCDQHTGKNFNRPRYTVMKEDVLEPGDYLIVAELDRLGRNKNDTLNELRYYKEHNIRVMILEIPTTLIDFSKFEHLSLNNSMTAMLMDAVNNMLVEMYASFAQVEIEKKEKRQREGIEAMKNRGEWEKYGRPRIIELSLFENEYPKVLNGEMKPFELIKKLGLKKSTYYKYKREYDLKNN